MESRRLYLDSVAACLRTLPPSKREDILEELGGHLDDRSRTLRASGLQKEEAMQEALTALGSAEEVGQSLQQVHERGTWGQALLAALPFVVFAVVLSIREWGVPPLRVAVVRMSSHAVLHYLTSGTTYIVFLAGMAAGWLRNMPTWAYPYYGFWFLFTLWWSGLRSPRTIFMGPRAWIPGLALIGILALITRGFRPLVTATRGAFRDWTRASLALYPAVAFVCWLSFDEITAVYEGPSLLLALLLCAAGVIGFIRSSKRWQRISCLLGGALAALTVTCTVLTFYWGGQANLPHLYPIFAAFAVVIVLLIPGSIGLVEKLWVRHAAR